MPTLLLAILIALSATAGARAQAADPYPGIAVPPPPASVAPQDVAQLRRAFDGLSQQAERGPARIVEDNVDAWRVRWTMLERAATSIDTTYFVFDKDV